MYIPLFQLADWEWMQLMGLLCYLSNRPYQKPPDYNITMVIPDSSSLNLYLEHGFSVSRAHTKGKCHMCFIAWGPLCYLYNQKHIRSSPRPLSYRTHLAEEVTHTCKRVSMKSHRKLYCIHEIEIIVTRKLFFKKCTVLK